MKKTSINRIQLYLSYSYKPAFFLVLVCRYLINFLLDSTVGLVVIYLSLQFMQVVVRMYHWDSLRFGEYGKLLHKHSRLESESNLVRQLAGSVFNYHC